MNLKYVWFTKNNVLVLGSAGPNKEVWNPQQIQDAAVIMNSQDIYVQQPIYYFYFTNKDDSIQKIKLKNDAIDDKKNIIIDNDTNIILKPQLKKFINTNEYRACVAKNIILNKQPKDIDQTDIQFRNFLKQFQIHTEYETRLIWSAKNTMPSEDKTGQTQYFFYIINNETDVVGYAGVELLINPEDVNYNTIRAYDTNCYIAEVNIREDFRSNHLCVPFLTFVINTLNSLGFQKIYIENSSQTNDGIPACFCYYKAGLNNNYNMYYQTNENENKAKQKSDVKLHKMSPDYCLSKNNNNNYYYISKHIGKTAKKKFKKALLASSRLRKQTK